MVGEPLVYSDATMNGNVLTVELSVMLPLSERDKKATITTLLREIEQQLTHEAATPMLQVTRVLINWITADIPLSPQSAEPNEQ